MQEIHTLLDQAARRKGSSVLCSPICTPFPISTLKLHCMMFPVVQKKVQHTWKPLIILLNLLIIKFHVILHEKWSSMANFSSLVLYLNNTVMLEGRLRIPAKSLFWICLKEKCSKAKISQRDRRKNSFTEGERQNSEASFKWSDKVSELKWV